MRMQRFARSLLGAIWPDGGQGTARRNAWAAMAADAKRARERASVEATVRAAAAAHQAIAAPVAVNG
jgi:hypothetical protein